MYFTDYYAYYFPTEQEFQVAGIFFDYVIAGASRSGLSCAETIRANDDSGSILVVSKEKVLPYKRTKLSKRLFQGYSEEDFLLYPLSWYTDQRISLYLGTGAVDLAPEINTLFLDDGRKNRLRKTLHSHRRQSPDGKGSRKSAGLLSAGERGWPGTV